jgi:RNA binding exosome subunit
MELPFKSARVSTLAHATEDEQKVIAALRVLLSNDTEIKMAKLKGHYGNPIISFEASIGQRKTLSELWQRIVEKSCAGELEKIGKIVDDRIDESCHLYLRFDKQQAYVGELTLTDSGDAIHLTLKIAAYPARKEVATKLVKEFIFKQKTRGSISSSIGPGDVDEAET